MTKQEAIIEMQRGEKLTHRYFSKDEWATLEGNHIITEDGVRITEKEFWLIRKSPAWEEDWKIFTPSTS